VEHSRSCALPFNFSSENLRLGTVKANKKVMLPKRRFLGVRFFFGAVKARDTMLALSDDATTQKLDAIDKVRLLLSELRDMAFYEEILSTLPQFVACGPQSGGKSSVIRRLSGISLPEASTLCTRVATVISMRREATRALRVTLSGPSGVLLNDSPADFSAVRPLVASAQDIARATSGDKAFVDDHFVTVYVYGPAMPNVTLVDLPGFHTADDSDTQTVNEMVARYINMPGTLALHIVKGDQDYDSLLGNDFMRKLSVPRVTVLTHCDKIEATAGGRARIAVTLDRTSENSSGTFAVDGTADDATIGANRETEALRFVQHLDCRIEVGVEPLARHLEERMREHLLVQYPKAVAKLRASLVATVARSAAIKPKAPIEEVHEMARAVVANLEGSRPARMDDVRSILERMTLAIDNHKIRPVTANIQTFYRKVDEFDDVVVGSSAYCAVSPDDKHVSNVTVAELVHKLNETKKYEKYAKWKTEDHEGEDKMSEIYSGESYHVDVMVEDITALARRRGVRNLVHADRLPIVAAYAQQFAEHYTVQIRTAADELRQLMRASVDAACTDSVCDAAKHAAAKLRTLVADEEMNAAARADEAIVALEQYNSDLDLLYSPNEHYLNSLIQQMVAADKGMASDTAGARHIWHNVRAYIKVQRKFVSELATKELIRTLVLAVERHVRVIAQTGLSVHMSELAGAIVIPPSLVREREMLHVRQKVLENALSMLAG
jgi:hypothetical protein